MSDVESFRQAVASQTSVAASVAVLVQSISAVLGNALEKGDPDAVKALADSLDADPKAWADAVLANTPSALLSAEPFSALPLAVQKAFHDHAAKAAAAAAKAAPKH